VKRYMNAKELTALFDMRYHTKEVDTIFKRVFG
jgi:adenylosuccinate lyase